MSRMQESQPQKTGFFPKIYRFITEKGVLIIISLVSLFVLSGIIFQSLRLNETLNQVEVAQEQRVKLQKELSYWQDIARQHSNYRDAYFKIATLQYQLGQLDQAQKTLDKVLVLDPNFENARVLGDKIEAQR